MLRTKAAQTKLDIAKQVVVKLQAELEVAKREDAAEAEEKAAKERARLGENTRLIRIHEAQRISAEAGETVPTVVEAAEKRVEAAAQREATHAMLPAGWTQRIIVVHNILDADKGGTIDYEVRTLPLPPRHHFLMDAAV